MITPRFTVDQDEEFLHIDIKISNIRFSAQAIEMVVNENLFVFSLPPYYLRLRFSCNLIEDERAHSEFVSKEEKIRIRIPKLNKGEVFPDLDLTAKLLARMNEPTAVSASTIEQNKQRGPLIQEMDDSPAGTQDGNIDQNQRNLMQIEQEATNFNWEVEQKLPDLVPPTSASSDGGQSTQKQKYGFNDQYSDMIEVSLSNGNDINDLSAPETMTADDRVMERLIKENIKFDPEYYANDYLTLKYMPDETALTSVLKWKSPYKKLFLKFQKENKSQEDNGTVSSGPQVPEVTFDEKEQTLMRDLPNKSYFIEDPRPLYYTLISILYAYFYELRSNEGDLTVESGWTVETLIL
ncbi:unnamed protein product [Ambrosiozyma monospora]|uniref:Unnamed protein product n=1 Tax=Ambrosiozyma monospora TaxID=43982 RepID=A0ACB5T6H9_AMBMO|nr:unnamed protein product [Ambrosiozyma monospora]